MHIVAITTSVNYTDYLAWCLESLYNIADGVVVVTQEHDSAIGACSRYNATPLVYDGWHDNGAKLNKSGAVRFAQERIHGNYPDAWYLLIDADIVMQKDARATIEEHATDADTLYSARRVDFHTVEELRSGKPTSVYAAMFAGYWQLYRRHVLYPEWSRSAEACDLKFASQFASCSMLPMTVSHLGREAVNWEGRRSPVWR